MKITISFGWSKAIVQNIFQSTGKTAEVIETQHFQSQTEHVLHSLFWCKREFGKSLE